MTWKKREGQATATLNTRKSSGFIPLLPQDGTEWVILLDWLEFAMSKEQLERVTKLWNSGMGLVEIADIEQRKPLEVFLSIIHQAEKGNKIRPITSGRI